MKNPEQSCDFTPAILEEAGKRFGLSTSDVTTLLRNVGDNARDVLASNQESQSERPLVQGTATSWEV